VLIIAENLGNQPYDTALQEEQLDIVKETDSLILEPQHMELNRGATEEDIVGTAVLEELLNILREDCDNIAHKKDSLMQEAEHIGIERPQRRMWTRRSNWKSNLTL
jgi:virulence-associated protein VagC